MSLYSLIKKKAIEVARQERKPVLIEDIKSLAEEKKWSYRTKQKAVIQERKPSLALSEDIADVISNGQNLLKNHFETVMSKSEDRGKMFYSHLYSITRYPVYETFSCLIPDAILVGPEGFVISSEYEIFSQSVLGKLRMNRPIITKGVTFRLEPEQGVYVSLLAKSTSYAHWLEDCLPKLSLIDLKDPRIRYLIPKNPRPYIRESLRLLGITDNRLVEMKKKQIMLEKLILCHAAQRSGVPNARHLRKIRDKLVYAAAGSKEQASTRRIYISRSKTKRNLVNESEIAPILNKYGFEIVCTEDLSFTDQVRMFSETNVVMGAHGAGMMNHIFCEPGATVIEIFNRQRWAHGICRVANIMGHKHWHVYGDDKGNNWQTFVDPDKLEKILEYALCDMHSNNCQIVEEPY